jgi:hypothetical protein
MRGEELRQRGGGVAGAFLLGYVKHMATKSGVLVTLKIKLPKKSIDVSFKYFHTRSERDRQFAIG